MRRVPLTLAAAAAALALAAAPAVGSSPPLPKRAQIYVVSVADGSVRQLTHGNVDHADPSWSPGGELVADDVDLEQRDKVEVLSVAGGPVRRFDAGDELVETPPSWSPDGRRLAFPWSYGAKTGAIDGKLVTVELATGKRRVIADRAVGVASWAPDGQSLFYEYGDIVGVYWEGIPEELLRSDIRTVRVDGTGEREVVRDVASDPALSPSGRRLFFFRRTHVDEGWAALWTATSTGQNVTRRTEHYWGAYGAWAPVGGIWMMGLGPPRTRAFRLTPDWKRVPLPAAVRGGSLDWSPHGRWLGWASGPRISLIRPDGSDERLLVRFTGDGGCGSLSWSPDGRQLLVVCGQSTGGD